MYLFEKVKEEINRGKTGQNKGIITSLSLINQVLYGIQRKTYYLLGAEVKSGKTAFIDQLFVLDAVEYCLLNNINIRVFYFSLEVDAISKLVKWIAFRIYRKLGIIISENELLSKGNIITPALEKYALETEPFFRQLLERVTIIDGSVHPTMIYTIVKEYCESNGKWEDVVYNVRGVEKKGRVYKANDPNEYVIFIVDHIGLLKKESSTKENRILNKKENIDRLSEYSIWLRNSYYVSPVLISQFNRSLADIDRQRFKEIRPQIGDFKETGNPAEDANVIGALFNPMDYNISTYLNGKYDISKLGNRFRSFHLLRNRNGDSGQIFGLNFLGQCGHFRHFPIKEKLTDEDYRNAITYEKFK